MRRESLISDAYLAEQKAMHAAPRGYGAKGYKWADVAFRLAMQLESVRSILDYGCGQGTLGAELRTRGAIVRNYDPAVPMWAGDPIPQKLVLCTDVLEHVEPDKLDAVLDHLFYLGDAIFIVVGLEPTDKLLSDGRQAHISLHPAEWWVQQFSARAPTVVGVDQTEKHLAVIAYVR